MESLLRSARRILQRHPSPGLPFHELHRLLSSERSGPPPDPHLLLERIRSRPGTFRVVDPWRGAWSPVAGSGVRRAAAADRAAYRMRLARRIPALDVWVLCAEAEPEPEPRRPLARLRETLRWLGRSLDAGSPVAQARWLSLVGRAGRLRRALRSGGRA